MAGTSALACFFRLVSDFSNLPIQNVIVTYKSRTRRTWVCHAFLYSFACVSRNERLRLNKERREPEIHRSVILHKLAHAVQAIECVVSVVDLHDVREVCGLLRDLASTLADDADDVDALCMVCFTFMSGRLQ